MQLIRTLGALGLVGQLCAASLEVTCEFSSLAPPAVLIWLPEDTSWRPTAPTVIDQRDRTFIPVIAVAPPQGTVEFRNSDDQQHNVFALDPTQHLDVDLGLGAPGSTLSLIVSWPSGAVVKHGCKIHPQMQTWIASIASAYHAVAALPVGTLQATLQLNDIPAGCTQLSFWAPRCTTLTVMLSPDSQTQILRNNKPYGMLRVVRRP